jgi:DHA1 family bicyclomycin/chloramphenicol resistance-like MFS transporter
MITWRVAQAVGACAGVVLARAMVRDLYEGDRAAQMISTLITVMAIASLQGPIVGAQILDLAPWRAIFWVLVGIGIPMLTALFTLPETLPRKPRAARSRAGELPPAPRPAPAARLCRCGWLLLWRHVRLHRRHAVRLHLLPLGTAGAAAASLLVGFAAWTGWGRLVGLIVPLFLFVGMAGFIVAKLLAGAMESLTGRADAVSALVGTFAVGAPWPMRWVIATTGLGSTLCTWLLVPQPATATVSAIR